MDNEYMNSYMKNRWAKRRAAAVVLLGGKCVICGSIKGLEFDHIEPSTKLLSIAKSHSRSEKFFWSEVEKCQLLCKFHHKEKTSKESGVDHGGGRSGKKNCPCIVCKAKKADYMKQYKKKYLCAGSSIG